MMISGNKGPEKNFKRLCIYKKSFKKHVLILNLLGPEKETSMEINYTKYLFLETHFAFANDLAQLRIHSVSNWEKIP